MEQRAEYYPSGSFPHGAGSPPEPAHHQAIPDARQIRIALVGALVREENWQTVWQQEIVSNTRALRNRSADPERAAQDLCIARINADLYSRSVAYLRSQLSQLAGPDHSEGGASCA